MYPSLFVIYLKQWVKSVEILWIKLIMDCSSREVFIELYHVFALEKEKRKM